VETRDLVGFVIAGSASLLIFIFSKVINAIADRHANDPRRVEIVMPDGRKFVVNEDELTVEKLDELVGPAPQALSSH
jgi:hypothetical protein